MEGSLYDLNQLFSKELGGISYDPYPLFLPTGSTGANRTIQQQTTPNIGGVFHNEESVDFSDLVEACEKNISPLSGSTRSSTGSFLEPEPSFTFENLLPDLNMYSGTNTASHYSPSPHLSSNNNYTGQQHLPVTSSLANVTLTPSNTNSVFSSQTIPPILSPSSHILHPPSSLSAINSPSLPTHSHNKTPRGSTSKTTKKAYDKNSEEYKDRRERNNVAVRKSRNKSKQRALETEVRVKELEEENVALQNKIALLLKELNVLKNLFSSADQPNSTQPSLMTTTSTNNLQPVSTSNMIVKNEVGNSLTGFNS